MSVCVVACETVKDEFNRLITPDMQIEFLPYRLHDTPQKLLDQLRQAIYGLEAETILLGYGLCSNGVVGLAPREGQRLVIPKAHDCISLFMGSRRQYHKEAKKCPGTFYLTKGWIDSKGDPLTQFESYKEKYGEETAKWVMDQQYKSYSRICLIDTGVGDMDKYREYSQKVASFLDVAYEEIKGTDDYFRKLLSPPVWDEDFLVIEHPREIRQSMFL